MESTTGHQIHPSPFPNPNPNPPLISSSHYSYYPSYPQIPTTQSSLHPELIYTYTDPTTLRPPGVDSYTSLSSYPHAQVTPAYYLDPNSQNWTAKEAVRQYGSDPAAYAGAAVGVTTIPANGTNGTELAIADPGLTIWNNLTFQPHGNGFWKKPQNKTKVVQSAYCEVCKVDCNSKDVLDQHKLGKKHRKNLEKLQAAVAGSSDLAGSGNPVIGPQENPCKGKTSYWHRGKKKAAEPLKDLESKRRKVVEGGAAAEAVRTCVICNVVCNSETVFKHHLAGQKHSAMLKKHAAGR